jgi:single-stranded-DNA-specific exonuclease
VREVIRLQTPQLIITVDNGISSVEGVELAHAHNVRVLVTDHHLPGLQIPDADAIVNPNQVGCDFPGKNLAGVGVIFYVISALRSRLRQQGYFATHNMQEPNMADYLDLVALGTVADMVPLDFYNRILVQQGLLRIRNGHTRPGIQALIELGKRDARSIVAEDMGFILAPRLNAAGRMDDISTGIQCLLSPEKHEAILLATELDDLNRYRKSTEKNMQEEALQAVEQLQLNEAELPWGLCVYQPHWHQGVVGLLASRLKERFHRPVIAFAPEDNGYLLKGSARSITGFHMRDALEFIATQTPGLIERFGGHAMAAGLSLAQDKLPEFMQIFDQLVRQQLSPEHLHHTLLSDGELDTNCFKLSLARQLRFDAPWGQHFPPPLFHGDFVVLHKRELGEQHLKLVLQPVRTSASQENKIDAIHFFIDNTLRQKIQVNDCILIAYRLDINEYRGTENIQLIIEHLEWQTRSRPAIPVTEPGHPAGIPD